MVLELNVWVWVDAKALSSMRHAESADTRCEAGRGGSEGGPPPGGALGHTGGLEGEEPW